MRPETGAARHRKNPVTPQALLTNDTKSITMATPKKESPYITGWDNLAEYLNTPKRNLFNLEKEGIIKKYKLGTKVVFRREEIDEAIKPVEN